MKSKGGAREERWYSPLEALNESPLKRLKGYVG